ncbi:prostaglandin E2 receptor EP3 subtype [Anabrus simplex]|uniref:prostaglandin E2 receptor EP3 subtype n=1 Tax=Anabrus simplex TaxID=316456 RepID=UPI0034DDC1D2
MPEQFSDIVDLNSTWEGNWTREDNLLIWEGNITYEHKPPREVLPPQSYMSLVLQIVITGSYVIGVIGNFLALLILYRPRRQRNRKHALMLRCLACNDLVALLGMLVLMYVAILIPKHLLNNYALCVARVLWRIFGLSSGCVAAVMAVERWLALTHPFLYQKHITQQIIRNSIFTLWAAVLVLVCLPFTGFGLYFENNKCIRYRMADRPKDVAYAFFFFTFGTLLCACIVWCNLAVVRALCRLGCRGTGSAPLGRRISRNSSSRATASSIGSGNGHAPRFTYNACTTEEVAFARLMAVLSISFVVCWAPQMISILLAQFASPSRLVKVFFGLADMLMAIHFTLDPYVYVLLRHQRKPCVPNLLKLICRRCSRSQGSQPSSLVMTDLEQCISRDSGASGQRITPMSAV